MRAAERIGLIQRRKYQLLEDSCDRGFPERRKLTHDEIKEAAGIRPQLQEDIYAAAGYVSRYRRKPMKGEAD